jgi:hypothetical protein
VKYEINREGSHQCTHLVPFFFFFFVLRSIARVCVKVYVKVCVGVCTRELGDMESALYGELCQAC